MRSPVGVKLRPLLRASTARLWPQRIMVRPLPAGSAAGVKRAGRAPRRQRSCRRVRVGRGGGTHPDDDVQQQEHARTDYGIQEPEPEPRHCVPAREGRRDRHVLAPICSAAMAPEPSPKTGTATGSTRPILHDTAAAHPAEPGAPAVFGPNPGIHQPPTRGHARPAAPLTIPTSTTCPYGHGPDRHVGAATGCRPSTPSTPAAACRAWPAWSPCCSPTRHRTCPRSATPTRYARPGH